MMDELQDVELGGKKVEMQMELDGIKIKVDKDKRIDVESFKQVNEVVDKNLADIQEMMDSSKETATQQIEAQYKALVDAGVTKEAAQEIKDKAINDLEADMADQEAEVRLQGIKFGMDTIVENYSAELTPAKDEMSRLWQDAMADYDLTAGSTVDGLYNRLQQSFDSGMMSLTSKQVENISELLEQLQPQADSLSELAQSYIKAGQSVPEGISKGLSDFYQLELMAGNTEHLAEYMALTMSNDEEYLKGVAQQYGENIPENIANAIYASSGKVYENGQWVIKQAETGLTDELPAILEYMKTVGPMATDAVSQGFIAQYGLVYDNGKWVAVAASDGLASQLPEVLNTYSQSGIDIPDSLITTLSGKSSDVQNQAAGLINQLLYASESERPGILAALNYLGVSGGDELVTSMNGKQNDVSAATQALLYLISQDVDNQRPDLVEKLRGLGIDISDAEIQALRDKSDEITDASGGNAENIVAGFDEAIKANGGSSATVLSEWANEGLNAVLTAWGIQSPSKKTNEAGKNTIIGFNNAINDGRSVSNNTIKAWATGMYNALTSYDLPGKAGRVGTNTGSRFVFGINSQASNARGAGRGLAQRAQSGIDSVDSSYGWDWGWDLGSGLANGIWATQGNVASAASSLAYTIRSYLHFSRPDKGPLRDYETYMPDFVSGLSETLKKSRPMLITEVENTSAMVAKAMSIKPDYADTIVEIQNAVGNRFPVGDVESMLRLEFSNDFEKQTETLSADIAALRGEIQDLKKSVNDIRINGINDETITERVKDAISGATINAVVDKRQAGQALTSEIDKNQGKALALRKRGI